MRLATATIKPRYGAAVRRSSDQVAPCCSVKSKHHAIHDALRERGGSVAWAAMSTSKASRRDDVVVGVGLILLEASITSSRSAAT